MSVAGRLNAGLQTQPSPLSVYLEPTVAAIRARIGGSGANADVAPDGTFQLSGVQPGEYHLRVHSGERARFFVSERTVLVDGRAPITGIVLDLDFSAGSVSGRALDVAGKPIPLATVVLQSVDPEKLAGDLYRHVYLADGTGSYSITGVVPGEYVLFAWRGDTGLIGDPDLFAQARNQAHRVTVNRSSAAFQDAIEMRNP